MSEETTTDRLAEIEGQAADYTPPEGWRLLQAGEVIAGGDQWIRPDDRQAFNASRIGHPVNGRMCYIRRIEPEPEPQPEPQQIITPDDVAAEALAGVFDETKATQEIAELQAQVKFLKNRELTLGTRLEDEKAVSTKRLEQVQELRSEVRHVQGLLGESQTRVVEQQNLIQELLITNEATEPQPVHLQAMIETQAETIARLHSEIHDLNLEIGGLQCKRTLDAELQQQLEAVKAELVQVSKDRQALQIELDAREQVPQAVSDRFEEGWDKGAARAVETIAEWLEPVRLVDNPNLANETLQHLPQIMRTLTGLADTED